MSNIDWLKRKERATPVGINVLYDFFVDRASGAELWDIEGKRYIDFSSGIAVVNTGHSHPRIISAVKHQLDSFIHTAYQIIPYTGYIELAEKVNKLLPGNGDKKTAFFTTGAEAVENAVKISRAYTKRPAIIAFNGGFHGRTLLGMALTGKVAPYKVGFGPFPGDIYHAPFPSKLAGISVEDSLFYLQELFLTSVDPRTVAAIIFEPVQGEGGFNIAPQEWVESLRKLCDEYGILLIADEIQTGFGRTGKYFALEHYGIEPDLITMAKSLASGLPLSGVGGKSHVMDAPVPGGLGGTYAGNPLAIAAAHTVISVLEKENLLEKSMQLGAKLKQHLLKLKENIPQLVEVRGLGGMVAAEFRDENGKPLPEFTRKVINTAAENGLLLLPCGMHGNVIRFLFPLSISDSLMQEGMDILSHSLFS